MGVFDDLSIPTFEICSPPLMQRVANEQYRHLWAYDRCGSGERERACARVQRAHLALAEAKRPARTPESAPARERGTRIQAFQVGGLSW
jgi:hypothetical protein